MIAPAALHPEADPLVARALGVLRSPRSTFEAVARRPRWLGVVTLAFFVTAGCTAALFETEVGQLALLDQWEGATAAVGLILDDGQYAVVERASRHGAAYGALSAFAVGPLLAVVLSGLLFGAFRVSRVVGRVASRPDQPVPPDVSYRQVLAVVGHAGVILALREVVAAPVAYAREMLASPLSLGMVFSMLDEASPITRFLGIIDFFVIWWMLVLAVGLSVLYGRPTRRLAGVFLCAYLSVAAAAAGVMAVTRGTT